MDVIWSYAAVGLVLCLGIFVQAAVGFAAGLFMIPLLLWMGEGLPEAQALLLVATIPQNAWGLWSLRDNVQFKTIAWPGIARISFLPLGMAMLMSLEAFPKSQLRQVVGGVVLAVTLAIIYIRPTPRDHLHPIWAWIAFPVSGFLQGLVGMGGPAMVFWVQAHDWSTRQIRAFMFAMYLFSIGPALLVLYFFFQERIIRPGIIAAATVPFLVLATGLGLKCGDWMGRDRLRRVTLGLLLLMGLAGLAAPLFGS